MPARVEVPLSRGQLARALNCSNRHLADLLEAGVIAAVVPGKGRRASVFDAMVAIPAALRHERQKSRPGVESARDRRDLSQAALNELRHAELTGRTVSREQVAREALAAARASRQQIEALARQLVTAGLVAPDREAESLALCLQAIDALVTWAEGWTGEGTSARQVAARGALATRS